MVGFRFGGKCYALYIPGPAVLTFKLLVAIYWAQKFESRLCSVISDKPFYVKMRIFMISTSGRKVTHL